MRIFFLSLPLAAGWGGSEELWADTARAALEDGHQVWITPRVDDSGNDARLRELQSLGARLVRRRQDQAHDGKTNTEVVPNAAFEIARTVDAIFMSAGGSVRELIDPAVRRLLEISRTKTVVSGHGDPEGDGRAGPDQTRSTRNPALAHDSDSATRLRGPAQSDAEGPGPAP